MPWHWVIDMALRALALDFKQTPRHWSALGLLLLVIGAIVLATVVNTERSLTGQIELVEARMEVLAKRGKIKPAQPLDVQELQQDIRQANDILQQLSLPWDALFKALEATSEKEIALLSIQPDVAKRIVRIGGEAKDFDALLAYITRLEQSKILNHVYLTSHEVRSQDAEKPVRFSLLANWTVQP
jgi:Tfp pilus assembly protein PilN